nr:Immunoglobulin [Hymenolepis microstoma]
MMNCKRWHILCLFVNLAFSLSEITLSNVAGNSPVFIGQSVNLRCSVSSRFADQTNLSVIFLRNGVMLSENCIVYHKDEHEVICDPDGHSSNGKTRTFLFRIKSVSWTDRGKWTCLLSASSSDIFLEVYVPPKMAPVQVTKITLPIKRSLSTNRSSDSISGANSLVELNPHSPQIHGLGTRTNPYDLRSGVELHLICQTECGYPKAVLEWTVNNMNDSEPRKIESSRNVISQPCEPRPQTMNMTISMIPLRVQCEAFNLTGNNKLRCAIVGANGPTASKHIYILCSGGERSMTLTGGEMIGLVVAGIALFSLLITGCVHLRNRSKGGDIITNGHNREELV